MGPSPDNDLFALLFAGVLFVVGCLALWRRFR